MAVPNVSRADSLTHIRRDRTGTIVLIYNATPFVPTLFPARDVEGRDYWVFLLKGTFHIDSNGQLTPAESQVPILESDCYRGELNGSSLRMESDLAPCKPRADIVLDAVALAPGGKATRSWQVRVRVGVLEKTLRVTGPRAWNKARGRYLLSEPEPVTEVPIVYERAFGGLFGSGDDAAVLEENPVGVGFVPSGAKLSEETIPAPQIEDPSDPIDGIGQLHSPQGFGPICRAWLPRRPRAGTFDDAWQSGRAPEWPLDHDEAFYNCAHPDLVYPGLLRGDEAVLLEGMAQAPIQFVLPALPVQLFPAPALEIAPPSLDTVHIDVAARLAILSWRTRFSAEPEPDVIGVYAGPFGSELSRG